MTGALLLLTLIAPSGAGAIDAGQLQLNAAHDGFTVDGPQAPLTQAWQVDVGDHPSYPIIAGGRVFVSTWGDDLGGPRVYALDRATGRVLWRRTIGGTGGVAGLSYDGGRLFVAATGRALAIDPATGVELWSQALPEFVSVSGAPVAFDGLVHIPMQSSGTRIVTLSQVDGSIVWQGDTGYDQVYSPAVDADGVYASNPTCGASGLDRLSGSKLWTANSACSGKPGTRPITVLHGGHVYSQYGGASRVNGAVAGARAADLPAGVQTTAFAGGTMVRVEGSDLVARDEESRVVIWSHPLVGGIATAPIVVGDTVWIAVGGGHLFGIALPTGDQTADVDLRTQLPQRDDTVYDYTAGLSSAEGTIVVPGKNTLTALVGTGGAPATTDAPAIPAVYTPEAGDGATGRAFQIDSAHTGYLPGDSLAPLRRRWTRDLGNTSYAITADGRVFAVVDGGYDGAPHDIVALDATTGATLWSRPAPHSSYSASGPAYEDDRVFVGNRAYDAATGTPLWESESIADGPPVARDGVVYLPTSTGIDAVKAGDGTLLSSWNRSNTSDGAPVHRRPLPVDGAVRRRLAGGRPVHAHPCGGRRRLLEWRDRVARSREGRSGLHGRHGPRRGQRRSRRRLPLVERAGDRPRVDLLGQRHPERRSARGPPGRGRPDALGVRRRRPLHRGADRGRRSGDRRVALRADLCARR